MARTLDSSVCNVCEREVRYAMYVGEREIGVCRSVRESESAGEQRLERAGEQRLVALY